MAKSCMVLMFVPVHIREGEVVTISMTREKFLEELIMDTIANDYEDFDMIVREVTTACAEPVASPSVTEITNGLRRLIDAGLARAYLLSPTRLPVVVSDVGQPELSEGLYFYLTQDGRARLG